VQVVTQFPAGLEPESCQPDMSVCYCSITARIRGLRPALRAYGAVSKKFSFCHMTL